jgi:hypothetical protein
MMVLKTEWTQLETIELQSDSSLSGKLSQQQYLSAELSGKASPVSFTGSGFGFGITGNKSTGVVVKAITIGGSAHKVNYNIYLFFNNLFYFSRIYHKFELF